MNEASLAKLACHRVLKAGGKLFLLLASLTLPAGIAAYAQAVQPSSSPEPRSTSTSTGAITGRVMSEEGRPLPDAAISVYKAYGNTGPPQTSTSDSDGRFSINNLAPGLYGVNARVPGFAQPDVVGDLTLGRFYKIGDSVTLTLAKGGVITGSVRDANGDPIVGIPVRALRIRDGNGRAIVGGYGAGFAQPRMTDDRGIYRIYGLPSGAYYVSAGGSIGFFVGVNPYDTDAPTYYPSSTRDTAAEVQVRPGEEAPSIDIRYRAERGHSISGAVLGPTDAQLSYGVSISLKHVLSGSYESNTYVAPRNKSSFEINGVADGIYEVAAVQGAPSGNSMAAAPQRVTVRGADVTGLQLRLAPLGSIAGRSLLEPIQNKEACGAERPATLVETLINARRDEKTQPDVSTSPFLFAGAMTQNELGDFQVRNLVSGNYRLTARLTSDLWYLRSIVLPSPAPPGPNTTAPKSAPAKIAPPASPLIALKPGENLAGVTVNIAQEGAVVRGRVIDAKEGPEGPPPSASLKLFLVPTERERADDVLRYSEVPVASDGTFALINVAPGRYWLLTRPAPDDEPRVPRPTAWDSEARAKLRRDAELANDAIELKPCQRVNDYVKRLYLASPAAK
ncbi:MAG: hypothetical protein QOJ64_4383 [Acidobacteriota bacterium]|jgi:hypothetical protein|nr:hypothetical protein [Acidobacteriota bacterium]